LKTLINNIITFLEAAITAKTLSAKIIIKGFDSAEPEQVPIEKFPYIAIDDGGERVDSDTASRTQTRVYSVKLFICVFVGNQKNSLDNILDLTNEVKTIIETKTNRQKDGHVWGIQVTPLSGEIGGTNAFWRGREVVIDYTELEDNYGEF